jgi:hypothetical protein
MLLSMDAVAVPLLYWVMLYWLVLPCALAGVNGFCGGTDFAKSAYLGGPGFIVASAVSGMVEDGHSSGSGASTRSLSRSSNHLPLTFARVYLHGTQGTAPLCTGETSEHSPCELQLRCRVVILLTECAALLC